jgi:hypothetical protein
MVDAREASSLNETDFEAIILCVTGSAAPGNAAPGNVST